VPPKAKPPSPPPKEVRRASAERRAVLAPLRKKIKDCERLLEKLRAEIQELDSQLAKPDLYSCDADRAAALAKARAERMHEFARAESDWLDLSEELDALEASELVG
jgi:ATP-binding cassette subfamily F protein 3